MDKEKATHWAAIIGLATAALALVTAFFTLQEGYRKANEQSTEVQHNKEMLLQQVDAFRNEMQARTEANDLNVKRDQQAAEHARICEAHQDNLAVVTSRYATLMAEHGQLMNFLKQCVSSGTPDEQKGCASFICAGAAALYGSNCVTIGSDVVAIRTDWEREKSASSADSCQVPRSAIDEFFKLES